MAHLASVPLMNTIARLYLISNDAFQPSTLQIIRAVYNNIANLQNVLLGKCSSRRRKMMDPLDGQIREAISELEDVLDSSLYNHYLSQSNLISVDEEQIQSILGRLKNLKEEYAAELKKPLPEEDDDDDFAAASASTSVDSDGKRSGVFGLSTDEITRLKQRITEKTPSELQIISVIGERGTTRTVFAKLLCEEASDNSFQKCAMVTVGHEFVERDILIGILSQIDDEFDQVKGDDEESLGKRLYICLKGRKFLVVLDDIWTAAVWGLLRRFPKEYSGCRIILTVEVAEFAQGDKIHIFNIQMNDQSWDLIRRLGLRSPSGKIAKIQRLLSLDDAEITEEQRLHNPLHGVEDVSSTINSADTIAQMLKLYEFVDHIILGDYVGRHRIRGLFGMSGIGKSTLLDEIIEDPSIKHHFDLCVWIATGTNYDPDYLLPDILYQIDPDIDTSQMMEGSEMLAEQLKAKAFGKRCLIVLDDLQSRGPLEKLRMLFNNISCEILLTTTLRHIASESDEVYEMRLLNQEESWRFLSEKVFGEKSFPPELEKAGKMIAEECEGLPLTLATVANLLSEDEKTPEFWTEVAMKQNLVFEDVYDITTEKLYPIYADLYQMDKPLFLYMGIFPPKYKVPTSKLGKLLSFEGILHHDYWYSKNDVRNSVSRLVSWSLLIEWKRSSSFGVKTCSLHSTYWQLCLRVARKNKFFHVLNRIYDCVEEYITGQHRLCIQNNVLFGMKDVHETLASNSTARSLVCTGPPHQYLVPIYLGSTLLRVLDVLTIRFYEFPIDVLQLLLLQYLGLTCDGKLPPSISKLGNLECLIVRRHQNIKSHKARSYLPKEIWNMKALKHLQVMGSDLPDPCGAVLPNLIILVDISAQSVMEGVLRGTPNLNKLGIRIELTPNASESIFIFNQLSHLDYLKSLKCAVVNPELIRSGMLASPPPISSLPKSLEKLSLSGFGYPWENMKAIGRLPNLMVLKLQCYAFQGPEWRMHKGEFKRLSYLLIEDTDLENLNTDYANGRFYQLKCLIMRHCYKLKKFPCATGIANFEVELVDCGTSASKCIPDKVRNLVSNVHSSWEKKKM